ncbi:MAG: hypothetical protein FWH27_05875 [Planctomycetaceae bacterium]|nr:hypothetical protein [Planctomycetaceae bacterium]
MTNNEKEFDAVAMMREAREQFSLKYWQRPDVLKQDMEEVRAKYSFDAVEENQPFEEVMEKC